MADLTLAYLRSFAWHLFYGMWRGYRETKTSDAKGLAALTSTNGDWQVVKVFWERPDVEVVDTPAGPWAAEKRRG